MVASFTHLHVHSHYSLLKALPKVPALVAAAKKADCTALALTDINALYGAIDFYKECKEEKIKPIIGVDVEVAEGRRLVLLAENETGYKNLLALISKANMAADGAAPLFPHELLSLHAQGLIAIVPALRGGVADALRARDTVRATRLIADYKEIFGNNNLFCGIAMFDDIEEHNELMQALATFAREQAVSIVAAQEAFYLAREDRRAWDTLRAIESKGARDEEEETHDADFSLRTSAEMERSFKEMPEALQNSLAITERISLSLTIGKFIFPAFALPPGKTGDEVLRELCIEGIHKRGLEGHADVLERLEYELGIIAFKGYANYFLVVEDLIRFAHEHGILTNIRGSVAGSITTYLLYITKIDPLEYKIPFERFLNPERPSAPDIDMDFADDRREEVINYARQKYGTDRVAQIGTFGTMLARGVVRDVSRALRHPYGLGDRIAKEIPMGSQGFPMTLARALEENATLAKMYEEEQDTKEIIDLGKKIEGCVRHVGVHAAGVVIAPEALTNFVPIQLDPKGGKIITQYDMYSVGEDGVGLTKFDFLGIRNLTILAEAVVLVQKTRNISVDLEHIPLNDAKTFAMLAAGKTEGTFQLNGAGMTKWLVELKPNSIHDINAMVALYRPGPMQFIPDYIARKHDPSLITYMDPSLEPILKQSYGILVYQDDLLIMAHELAGYTWGEVDKFRKAVGKKIPAEMAKQKNKFIEGCISHAKWPQKKAEKVWEWLEPFAAYGFNKAHSASYGRVAYQTAYMKANFPVEYMAAVLSAEAGNIDTVSVMVAECKQMGIPVLPPDINESFGAFTVILASEKLGSKNAQAKVEEKKSGPPEEGEPRTFSKQLSPEQDAIRFGLYSIKNFGTGVADSIIAECKAHGPFTSLSNFLSRVTDQGLNKKGLESLIQCGALDCLSEPGRQDGGRGQMLASIELLLEYHRHAGQEQTQDSLFAGVAELSELRLPAAPEASMDVRLAWEKELLGLYVSGHPLDKYKELLAKRPMTLRELKQKIHPGTTTVVAGMVTVVRNVLTRTGDQMAFITIADFDDAIEVVIFPKVFAEFRDIVTPECCIAIKGRLTSRNGELSIAAEKLKAL